MKVLITGGAGFIGSAAVRHFVLHGHDVLNIDKLTYAGDLRAVESVADQNSYRFYNHYISDKIRVQEAFEDFSPEAVLHLAAESHVDRSIDHPMGFVQTNVMGTAVLLGVACHYWESLQESKAEQFRFIGVSTNEVYGSLGETGLFSESSPYDPRSPYSASKAGSDHLVMAWNNTYGLPSLVSNCSNIYGPFQHAEKLIPTILRTAISGQKIPIYGTGNNVRDRLCVDDQVRGLELLIEHGVPGQRYNFGGQCELDNLILASKIYEILDSKLPRADGRSYRGQITFVSDRAGHDFRYAVDTGRVERELGWSATYELEQGLEHTVN